MRGGKKTMVLKVRDPSVSHICFCNMTVSLENLSEEGFFSWKSDQLSVKTTFSIFA